MPASAFGPKVGSSHQPTATPTTIEPILKNPDARAGRKKIRQAFSIPITRAASETSRMKGNMMRASPAARACSSGLKPLVMAAMICGENTMPRMVTSDMKTTARVITFRARAHPACSPSRSRVLENVVTNAVLSAPSANRSRSRFGARKAAMKHS